MKARVLIPVAMLGVIGGVAAYFLGTAGAASEPSKARTVRAQRGSLTETAAASGTIVPVRQVDVKSRTSGEVIEVLVTEGQRVAEGDLLFRLDPTEAERTVLKAAAALERLNAQLTQAKASLTIARYQAADAKADKDLNDKGAELGVISDTARRTATNQARIASATVQQRLAEITSMEAQMKTAELEVQVAELNLAYTRIVAPFAGTVLALNVEKGTIVASGITNVSGGTAALTLGALDDLRVVAQIDEAQVSKVQKDQPVQIRVDAYPDRVFEGVVEAVAPLGQNVSNVVTFDVEIRVTDKDRELLRSGMSADLEIITRQIEGAIFVPLTAIVSRGAERFVRLADGSEQAVKTGATDGQRIVILEGLDEGTPIQAIGATARATGGNAPSGGLIPMGGRGSRGPRMRM